MELKLVIFVSSFSMFRSSNRTFMELKQAGLTPADLRPASSNRTFMELKQDMQSLRTAQSVVLIVPLWN